jgi:hypothetical protein
MNLFSTSNLLTLVVTSFDDSCPIQDCRIQALVGASPTVLILRGFGS